MPRGSYAAEAWWGFLNRRDESVEKAVAAEDSKSITLDLPYDQAVPR